MQKQIEKPGIAGLCIRQAQRADLPAMEWEGEFTHFRAMYVDAFQMAERGLAMIWLAEIPVSIAPTMLMTAPDPAYLVGQMMVSLSSGRLELADGLTRAYIYGFRVRPALRGLGVGTAMMRAAEQELRQRRFGYATLNVGRDNPRARALYQRLGYRVVAAEPGHWFYLDENGVRREVNEPAWRMEKVLGE